MMNVNAMNTVTLNNIPDLPAVVVSLVDAMNANNARFDTPYAGYEITEMRRKYMLLNSVLRNGQRSGVFLIDRETLNVYQSRAYGKAGRVIGTVESLTKTYNS